MNRFLLSRIKPEYYPSIADYNKEMQDNHEEMHGCCRLEDYDDMEKWHLNALLFEKEETLPPGYSQAYEYLFLEDDEVIGMVDIRPKALQHVYLKVYGGHIGYSIRPSRRNKGIGTRMLKEALLLCKSEFQLDKVLITCEEDNEASRKVIMNNGGVYEDKVFYPPDQKMIERYWISL